MRKIFYIGLLITIIGLLSSCFLLSQQSPEDKVKSYYDRLISAIKDGGSNKDKLVTDLAEIFLTNFFPDLSLSAGNKLDGTLANDLAKEFVDEILKNIDTEVINIKEASVSVSDYEKVNETPPNAIEITIDEIAKVRVKISDGDNSIEGYQKVVKINGMWYIAVVYNDDDDDKNKVYPSVIFSK